MKQWIITHVKGCWFCKGLIGFTAIWLLFYTVIIAAALIDLTVKWLLE